MFSVLPKPLMNTLFSSPAPTVSKTPQASPSLWAAKWISLVCSLLLLCGTGTLVSGCHSKEGDAPQALSLDQAPKAIEEAFKTAKPELKTAVAQLTGALVAKDKLKAEAAVQELAARTDLNKAQRQLAGRLVITISQELQAAAAGGDEQAQEVVRFRNLSK